MAKEYIDREDAVKILNRHSYIANESPMDKYDYAIVKELYSIKEEFKDIASADVAEVRHGKWEYGKWEQGHWVKGNERCRCSVCDRDFAVDNLNIWYGCPHCLARMDG